MGNENNQQPNAGQIAATDIIGGGISAGQSLIGGLIGMGIQQAENEKNRKWSSEEAAKARLENFEYGEFAAQAADRRQRNQYYDMYSPEAYMLQLQKAGLSPSLIGGTPPSGGTATGQQGGGASGAGAPQAGYASAAQAMIGGMEAMSQVELNKALANKADAETQREKGEGKMGEADFAQIMSDIGLKNANTKVADANATHINIVNKTTGQVQLWELEKLKAETYDIWASFDMKTIKNALDTETFDTLVKQRAADLSFTLTQNREAQQRINESIEHIAQEWKRLQIYEKEVYVQQDWYAAQIQQMYDKMAQDKLLFETDLGFRNKKVWIDAGTAVVQTCVHEAGSMAGAMLIGKGLGKGATSLYEQAKGMTVKKAPFSLSVTPEEIGAVKATRR